MNVSVSGRSSALLMVMVIAAVAGCAEIRKLTYPEDFVYLEDKEVESLMQSMTDDIVQLNRLLTEVPVTEVPMTEVPMTEVPMTEVPVTDTELQKKIVAELGSIEATALRLSGGHKQTNQFFIGEHIQKFIADVGTAKMLASTNPPRYNKARVVMSGCQECHQFR